MMAVLYVLADITIEPAAEKKKKGQMNVSVLCDRRVKGRHACAFFHILMQLRNFPVIGCKFFDCQYLVTFNNKESHVLSNASLAHLHSHMPVNLDSNEN